MRMTLLLLLLCTTASCVSIDGKRLAEITEDGAREQRHEIAAAAVEFRDQNGHWPENIAVMEPFMNGERHPLFETMLKERVELRAGAKGLEFVDAASGETAFTVSNGSTTSRPVILDDNCGLHGGG